MLQSPPWDLRYHYFADSVGLWVAFKGPYFTDKLSALVFFIFLFFYLSSLKRVDASLQNVWILKVLFLTIKLYLSCRDEIVACLQHCIRAFFVLLSFIWHQATWFFWSSCALKTLFPDPPLYFFLLNLYIALTNPTIFYTLLLILDFDDHIVFYRWWNLLFWWETY